MSECDDPLCVDGTIPAVVLGFYESPTRKPCPTCSKMRYVLGFCFDPTLSNVLLILKRSPAWQAGKLNGVGGKIEKGETPIAAMVREADEEVGINAHWYSVALIQDKDYELHVFAGTDSLANVQQKEEEQPIVFPHDFRSEKMIPNLEYLIPMCRYALQYPGLRVGIKEKSDATS